MEHKKKPQELSELISEEPDYLPDLVRVKHALSKANNPLLHGPRTHGSKVYLDDENIGLLDAVSSMNATEIHTRDDFTYLVFPIKKECKVAVNAVPSYLLPSNTKVEVAISPKGTPQVVAEDDSMGLMYPSGDLVVILGENDRFVTWFPTSNGEEPWEMTALKEIPSHLAMAKAGRVYRISELESYLGGSFDVVKKSKVFKQTQ